RASAALDWTAHPRYCARSRRAPCSCARCSTRAASRRASSPCGIAPCRRRRERLGNRPAQPYLPTIGSIKAQAKNRKSPHLVQRFFRRPCGVGRALSKFLIAPLAAARASCGGQETRPGPWGGTGRGSVFRLSRGFAARSRAENPHELPALLRTRAAGPAAPRG